MTDFHVDEAILMSAEEHLERFNPFGGGEVDVWCLLRSPTLIDCFQRLVTGDIWKNSAPKQHMLGAALPETKSVMYE